MAADPGGAFEAVLAELIEREEAGRPADWDGAAARHPHLADQLRAYRHDHEWVARLVRPAAQPDDERIGRFVLRQLVGQGTFGRVYRAFDPTLARDVALKVPAFPPDREALVERFRREARAAARLRHPNIVAVFETGQADGRFYIASEFVTGRPLTAAVGPDRPSVRRAAEWARALGMALNYAHELGVVHRDVKPANILIDASGRPLLTDFGLAKLLDLSVEPAAGSGPATTPDPAGDPATTVDHVPGAATDLTRDGAIIGTPAYMAPEQARGATADVGPLSDQFALAVVLYELLTGRRPFDGPPAELLKAIADPDRPAPPPEQYNPGIPAALSAVCLRALAKRPGDRFPTTAAFAVALQQALAADRPADGRGRGRSGWRRRPGWACGSVVAGRPLRPNKRRPHRRRLRHRRSRTHCRTQPQR